MILRTIREYAAEFGRKDAFASAALIPSLLVIGLALGALLLEISQ